MHGCAFQKRTPLNDYCFSSPGMQQCLILNGEFPLTTNQCPFHLLSLVTFKKNVLLGKPTNSFFCEAEDKSL
jgi:hypothetical protein